MLKESKRKPTTKIQAGDTIYFRRNMHRSMEGEVVGMCTADGKVQTLSVDFYNDNINLEFRPTSNGYKIIKSNSPSYLVGTTFRHKMFTVVFRPGTANQRLGRKATVKDILIQLGKKLDNKTGFQADIARAIRIVERI